MTETTLKAEFAAVVLQIAVGPGDQVQAGQELMILESMKTEIPVSAPHAGHVRAVHVLQGAVIGEGHALVTLEA